MSRSLLVAVCVAVSTGMAAAPPVGSKPLVSLLISKVTARRVDGYTFVVCRATLDNATGRELTVRSQFYSAFDGLEIVVMTHEGKVLAKQSYVAYDSPFKFSGRDFPLKKGKTVKELRFPFDGLPLGVRSLRVRLVGTLPGSRYKRILSSETVAVEVKLGSSK